MGRIVTVRLLPLSSITTLAAREGQLGVLQHAAQTEYKTDYLKLIWYGRSFAGVELWQQEQTYKISDNTFNAALKAGQTAVSIGR